tara:strand:- start:1402 stop:2262 length:861 start_codon:yes stop_codon:yes gene_type:complete
MDINMNSIMGVPYQTTYWNEIGTNPVVLLVVTVIIIAYYALFATLGVAKGQPASEAAMQAGKGIVFMEVLLWGVFVLLVLINGMTYIFNIDITASIKNLFSATPEIDIIVDPDDLAGDSTDPATTVPEIKLSKQVFHVPGNKYGYEDSKAICRAYGARLATWKEMDQAFNKGADWCSFGWSDGQMALYPTQYDKWAKLQKIEGHEQDCGRPGINGGYIANPNVRFGVNCYGYRPKITQEEAEAMKLAPLYPRTRRERAFDKRVDYWRDNLSEIQVAPFNHNNWSVI